MNFGQQQTNPSQESRRNQLANRNASTFNPISFNPDSQTNLVDYEKIQKKEKQAAYRQLLDNQGATKAQNQKQGDRANAADEYFQLAQRGAEPKHTQQQNPDNQRRQEEEAYLQEQYKKMAEYERYQQQMDEMEKNYGKASNPYQDASEAYSHPAQEPRHQQQHQHRQEQQEHQDVSTFQQQDNQREQLLNKIKGGYSQQNSNVWNSYQRAHDAKEKDKKEFEQSLVNKAAQDRQKEDVRAMSEFDRKKRLQQEAADANRRAAEIKMLDKRKQRDDDAALENQRVQDSLSQFEQQKYYQKESQRKLREEANRVLEQQVRESHARKQDKEHNVTLFGHPSQNASDEQYYGGHEERNAKTPLVPAHSRINQAQPGGVYGEALDNLSLQMEKQLAMKGGQGYQQNQYAPQQYEDHNQGYKQNQYSAHQYGGESRGQNRNQESQNRNDFGNGSDYQRNRLKNRNTGYNIITGELR